VGVALLVVTASVGSQALPVTPHREAPPGELAPAIAALLPEGGARVQVGETTLTFWWVRSLALTAGASGRPAWAQVPEGSLVGVVQVAAAFRDIRGRSIKPGVYTLRYGIQPADGDHLGVSTYRDFLLLSPARVDQDAAPTGHDGTIALSKQTIGGSHPAPWMLDPPVTDESLYHTGTNEMGFTYVVFEVPTSGGGALRFGLVLVGKVEA
jgi:hypothetical protein